MSDPKKHHYLPQFYLRNFAISPQSGKYPHIWACRKAPDPNPLNVAVKDTACTTDYYTLDPDKQIPDRASIEKTLSTIENAQSRIIKKILSSKRLQPGDEPNLAAMVSLMRTRGPSFKRYIEESLRLSVVSTMDLLEQHGRLPEPPESIKPFLKGRLSDNLEIDISNWMLLRYMFDAAIHSRIAQILTQFNPLLIEATGTADFVTSDSPVAIYQSSPTTPSGLVRPLFDASTEYWMPISPRMGILYKSKAVDQELKATDQDIAELNRRSIISAAEYVYSSSIDGVGVLMIPRYCSQSSGFSVQRLEHENGNHIVTIFNTVSKA